MKILVTGANGFVGKALCASVLEKGHGLRKALRHSSGPVPAIQNDVKEKSTESDVAYVESIGCDTEWSQALEQVDVVIHLAARVHVMHENANDPLAEFRRVNAEGTEHLARSAAASGVRRLVYVSSIKVNGEETSDGHIYSEKDIPAPLDPYGSSKWEAEQLLQRVAQETGMEIVIVRPPLVYGAGVKGNFAQMMRVIARGLPLPLASVRNKRDLVYVGNLVDALIVCATHPAAAGNTYLISDGEPVSTPELLGRLALALGVTPHTFHFPPALLKLAGRLVGRSAQLERLLGSLQVDSGKIRRELNWNPPYSLQQGLQATAVWYRNSHL